MNKKMILRLLFIFIFSLLVYTFLGFNINNDDGFNNFGFSYGILHGEIPYLDFNIISTPLYAFYQTIFLLISNQYIMFIIGQCILITIMFYFLFKEFDKKAYYILLVMIGIKYSGFAPTYNFMCLFWFIILMYLENKHSEKDYLIGLIIGLCALSKHTIGLLLIIPTFIYYYKDIKKIGKRVLGFLIPWLIFIIYLIVNKALFKFIDLCFLGLFDFSSNNGKTFSIYIILTLILFIISIWYYIKNKNIRNLYFLFTISFAIPIFDLRHFIFYLICFVLMILPSLKEINKAKLVLIIGLLCELTFFNTAFFFGAGKIDYYKNMNHLVGRFDFEINVTNNIKLNKEYQKYKDKNPIVLSGMKTFIDVVNDNDIDNYNIFLYGNYGYNGNQKEINKIKKMHNQYFLIDKTNYKNNKRKYDQFNIEIIKYIIKNSKKVENNNYFWLYYKE